MGGSVLKHALTVEDSKRIGHHKDRVRGVTIHCCECVTEILGLTNADELITVHPAPTAEDRLHSITLLAHDFRIAA